MMFFYIFLPKGLRDRLRKNGPALDLLGTIVAMAVVFLLLAVSYRVFEHQPWMESFWQSWQTQTTVGYGNAPAATISGRVATIVLGTIGIALLGVLFSRIFAFTEYRRVMRRMGMKRNPHRDGYIIFNFPGEEQLSTFIGEIRTVEEDARICVVDNHLEQLPERLAALNGVHFVRGSALAQETFDQARVSEAKKLIVFPVEGGKSESDATTKIIVDLLSSRVGADARVVYILVDPRNEWMFKDSSATAISESLETLALVQECQDRYTSPLIENILMNSRGANPHTVDAVGLESMSWGTFTRILAQLDEEEDLRVRPFGLILADGSADACPSAKTPIESGHHLSILSYNGGLSWPALKDKIIRRHASG